MKPLFGVFMCLTLLFWSCGQTNTANQKEQEKTKFNTEQAKKDFSDYKTLIDRAKESKKLKQKLREEIGLKAFNLSEIEIAQAELWYDGDKIVRIDMLLFKGLPVGAKHWYIKDGTPVGVEVAELSRADDASISEKPLYTLYFDANNNNWEGAEAAKAAPLNSENKAEWELLKGIAEKYKPKAE